MISLEKKIVILFGDSHRAKTTRKPVLIVFTSHKQQGEKDVSGDHPVRR